MNTIFSRYSPPRKVITSHMSNYLNSNAIGPKLNRKRSFHPLSQVISDSDNGMTDSVIVKL